MGAEDDEDSAVERGLTICRKVLIALLVFLALLYYVTYEYDEVYYENQNGQVRKKAKLWKFHLFRLRRTCSSGLAVLIRRQVDRPWSPQTPSSYLHQIRQKRRTIIYH